MRDRVDEARVRQQHEQGEAADGVSFTGHGMAAIGAMSGCSVTSDRSHGTAVCGYQAPPQR